MTYEVTINPDVTFGFPIKVYKGEDRELALQVIESYIKAGEHPRIIEIADSDENKKKPEQDYLTQFFVVETDRKQVTRYQHLATDGRPLTRRELYAGREGRAECEYAHAFMCGGFPTKESPGRPSKDEWMDAAPFPFEVDEYLSEKLFG